MAPNGNDANPGTLSAPFASLEKLKTVMVAGDRAHVRGGVYNVAKSAEWGVIIDLSGLQGTASRPIIVENYPGEQPVFDFRNSSYTGSGATAVRLFMTHHMHLIGLRFTGFAQNTDGKSTVAGIDLYNSTNNRFERVEIDHVGGYGVQLGGGAHDNLFLNVDVHHIDDRHTGWGNANGFSITGSVDAQRNVFDGCRAYCVSDDGFDLFDNNSFVTIRNSWAFWNGFECLPDGRRIPRGDGMGMKLGPHSNNKDVSKTLLRVLTNNIAFENKVTGFDQNGGRMVYQLHNNTAFGNGSAGYWFDYFPELVNDIRNNVAHRNPVANLSGPHKGSYNTWNRAVPTSDVDFRGLSSAGADGPRAPDGSLPSLPFLKPAAGSSLIDAGTNVGLPFNGPRPDLGAYER